MPIEGPSLQARALDAVRSGDEVAQRGVIDSILSEGVTAAEYTTTQTAVRGLRSEVDQIATRISRHLHRAKELSNSGRPNESAQLLREIQDDTALMREMQGFTQKLSTEVTLGRGATKLGEAIQDAMRSLAAGVVGIVEVAQEAAQNQPIAKSKK